MRHHQQSNPKVSLFFDSYSCCFGQINTKEERNESMFKNTKAFSSFSADDLQKTRQFYSQTLGLEVSESYDGWLLEIHIAGDRKILIYPKSNHIPATFTILNFPVDNLEQAIEDLTRLHVFNRGILRTTTLKILDIG